MAGMNTVGIPGIPYFGKTHNHIERLIKTSNISYHKSYSSLLELVECEKSKDKIVIIEYNDKEWLSYFRDIKFNYRDGICFIPFYTYDIYETDLKYIAQYKGHMPKLDGNRVGVRYNYCLRQEVINLENNSFILYDLEENERYEVSFDKLYDLETFDIEKLYSYYLDYSRNYEDNLIHKHTEGYHVITRNIAAITNAEKNLRKKYKLNDYINSDVNIYYRDVRNLSEKEYTLKIGIDLCDKPYWERRLDFESFLYCILHSNAVPDNDFKVEWLKLGKSKDIVKYGDSSIKLIFKSYWLPNSKEYKRKSWSRI